MNTRRPHSYEGREVTRAGAVDPAYQQMVPPAGQV